jgi:hypothetical protein
MGVARTRILAEWQWIVNGGLGSLPSNGSLISVLRAPS